VVRIRRGVAALALAAVALPSAAAAGDPAPSATAFTVEEVGPGLTLYRPRLASPGRANSLVVERAADLLVVDAQPSPAAARELIAQVAERSPKPIRYLVLSHSHAEAAGGASAFPADTLVLASAECAAALADPDYDFAAELGARATDAADWTEPARPTPSIVLAAAADLPDADHPVELRVWPRAHSRGDLAIHLPRAGLLYVGGLLPHDRDPFAADGNVGTWIGVLNSIIVDGPRRIAGTRAPSGDLGSLVAVRDSLAWLRGRVEEGFVDRLPPEEIAARVLGEADLARWFDPAGSFVPGLVERVIEEAITHRRKRGAWPESSPPAPGGSAVGDGPARGSS
jgi:glyoxylase-like metal-dependent hydrolase (beta-lactamase superfamily II)